MKLIALLIAVITSQSLYANSLEDAAHAMRAGNFAEAYCMLRPLAEDGEAEAQFNVGWMYQNGYGLAINNALALEWWRRASEQGHIDASFAIATLYNHGEGDVGRDHEKAIDYFLLAAQAGHDDAILIVRSMLIRDDKAIRHQREKLIDDNAALFGPMMQVRVKRVNVRQSPDLEAKIVLRLELGASVVELNRIGGWSQVGIVGHGLIAWIYSSLLGTTQVNAESVMQLKDAGNGNSMTGANEVKQKIDDPMQEELE